MRSGQTWALFPGTILAGLSIAVLNVLLPSLVKRRFPTRIGSMMAAYTMAMAIGASLAAGLTALVLRAADGSIEAALGIWAIPAGLALLVWLPQLRPSTPTGSATAGRAVRVWRQPLAWHVLFYMGMQSLLYYGPLSWLPAIYRDRGVDAAEAGLLLLVFNGLGIVGNLVAPLIAARLPDQRPAVAVAIVPDHDRPARRPAGADLDRAALGGRARDRPGLVAEPGAAGDRPALV